MHRYYFYMHPRYTIISPGYKIPGYFTELSSGKYTAQFKNFTTARMHRHMYGFQWHFGVIFPSLDTIWSIILFTMYYFTAINIFLSLHYTEILNSIIIPSIPYRTRQARSLSLRATHKFTTNINLWQFSVLNRSINSTLPRFIIKLAYNNYQFLSFILSCFQDLLPGRPTFEVIPKRSRMKEIHCESPSYRKSRPLVVFSSFA